MKRIVINTAIKKYRENKTIDFKDEIILKDSLDEDIDMNSSNLSLDFLLNLIQKLPNKYRLIFNLYVLDNYSHKEISKLLNISEGTSKSNLSRARKILKEKIKDHSNLKSS